MGVTANRTLIEKADLAVNDLVSDGGYLVEEQAKEFFRIAIKSSNFVQMCTNKPMASHTYTIPRILFDGRVLRPGEEATAIPAGERAKPTTSGVTLSAKLFKGEVRLNNEVLDDSVERGDLKNTIMQLMGDATGRDVEDIVLNGDTASTDTTLAVLNGIRKQATSHVVDALGTRTTKTTFRDMIKALPSQYLKNKAKMKFLSSVDSEIDYDDSLSDRATVLGDSKIEQAAGKSYYKGCEILPLPLMPEDIGAPATQYTQALFLDPKNVAVGWWRKVMIETDKDISAGEMIIVVSLRMDVKYILEDAVVKTINLDVA